MKRFLAVTGLVLGLTASTVACSSDDGSSDGSPADASACFDAPDEPAVAADATTDPPESLVLLAHDSFTPSEGILDQFTAATGIAIEVRQLGDTGRLVSETVLTVGDPLGDVVFGIDNTFLCRALPAGVLTPIDVAGLAAVPEELLLDPAGRAVPIDYGDVCLNVAPAALGEDQPVPAGFQDLTDPVYAGAFVTEDPETSSPGLAFLLATVAALPDDWRDYWAALADNDIEVAPDWSTAYFSEFAGGGDGDRPVVTSYATSPVAEVVLATEPIDRPSTTVIADSCFRQVEFAGVLAGSDHPAAAAALVEFLLSPVFQADVPLAMFVYPARSDVALPDVYDSLAAVIAVTEPQTLDPETIEANRNEWTAEWREIVLG